ncbi:hypothetical protein [Kitasatospora sp. NPDC001547]|uniref:hypothetical protein n=1 Tax=Kitasatospora sp. NPDC001547 TaxID=3364015 RepID=UPI0036BCCA63
MREARWCVLPLPTQELVLGRHLVQDADEGFDIRLELGDLLSVGGPEFLETADLFAQALLAVWGATEGADPLVELVLQVGVPLDERLARYTSFAREGDDGQRAVGVLRCLAQDAVNGGADSVARSSGKGLTVSAPGG